MKYHVLWKRHNFVSANTADNTIYYVIYVQVKKLYQPLQMDVWKVLLWIGWPRTYTISIVEKVR